jgi:pimeloyl-ACP methyl ester carboxylesterase
MLPDGLSTVLRRLAPTRPSPRTRSHTPPTGTGRPPLLFVHGAMHGAWCWEENWIPAAVERGWPCHAVDLAGLRRDGEHARRRWTRLDLETDVGEAVATLPEEPVLVGHSTSAVVVQELLADGCGRAGVLVAPVPPTGGYKFPLRVLRRHPTDLVRIGLLRPLPPRREYVLSDRLDDAAAARYVRRLAPASVRTQLEFGIPRRPPEVDAPVLVLGAEDDALVDPVDVVRVGRHHGTTARMFRGMGHSMMLDAGWRAPLEVMLHWLEAVVAGEATRTVGSLRDA